MEDLHKEDAHDDQEPELPAVANNKGTLNRANLHRACQVLPINQNDGVNREYISTR